VWMIMYSVWGGTGK